MRTYMQRLTVVLVILWAATAHAQPIGCNGGQIDFKQYSLAVLGAVEGQPAPDWAAKLSASGFPAPQPNTPPNTKIHFGITQSIGAGGPRGRLWLPTAVAEIDENGNRWYTRTIDVVKHETQTWMWLDRGGNPPLVVECGTLPEPPEPPQPPSPPIPPSIPPSGDIDKLILTEVQALRLEEALRWQQVQKTYGQLVGGIFKFLGKYILPIVGGYLISDQLTK